MNGIGERRQYRRYAVDWRASLMPAAGDSRELVRDQLHDISLGGAGLWSHEDIYTGQELFLLVELPTASSPASKTIVGIDCRMCPTSYVESRDMFHVGLRFTAFHGIGKHLLAGELIQRQSDVIPGA